MTLDEYQSAAQSFNIVPDDARGEHAIMGLVEEVGELAGLRKRNVRGDLQQNYSQKVKHELGDILWYLADVAAVYGFTLEEIAQANISKLTARASAGTIKGSGDR